MYKIFKCDCGTHLIEIGYTKPTKKFDAEDMFFAIYDLCNPDTGRKYKNPKLISDVVIFNNNSPKEVDILFKFLKDIIKNRKEPKDKTKWQPIPGWNEDLDKAIERIKKMNKKQKEKEKKRNERLRKNKKNN